MWFLKTMAKPRFLKHENSRAWSLTNLEICGNIGIAYCGIGLDVIFKITTQSNMSAEDKTYFHQRRTEEKSNKAFQIVWWHLNNPPKESANATP